MPSFAGSAAASGQGLLLVGDIGFEDHKTSEGYMESPEKDTKAVYSFQDVSPLANVLKEQELQPPLEVGN